MSIETLKRAAEMLRRLSHVESGALNIANDLEAIARLGPLAWMQVGGTGKHGFKCVSNFVYRSMQTFDTGVTYIPLYDINRNHTIETAQWNPLTDEDRAAAFESLPDMMDGFLKKWGWLHFAKEIERRCKEKNAPQSVWTIKGWKLAPIDPTVTMLAASGLPAISARSVYIAMIDAGPKWEGK